MPCAPSAAMARVRSTATRVSLLPAPASTGTSPASSSVMATTRFCSSALMVTLSPVVPHGTSTSMRASTCRRTRRRRAASSRAPVLVNGVTSAVPAPANERAIVPPRDPFILTLPGAGGGRRGHGLSRALRDVAQRAQLLAGLRRRARRARRALHQRSRVRPLPRRAVQEQLQLPAADAEGLRLAARHVARLARVRRAVVEREPGLAGVQRRAHHLEARVEGRAEVAVVLREQAIA